jgi:hypothetical protein
VDVQQFGFWFAVRAWAPYMTSWLVHYGFLPTWEDVERILFETSYPVDGDPGRSLKIFRACIDTGGSKKFEDMTMTDGHQLISRGVGGGSSGNPAMYVVIDDPFSNRQDASSPVVQESVEDWYDGTAVGRLGPGAGVLIMHTRWDIMDLAGRLLKRYGEPPGCRIVIDTEPNVDDYEARDWRF